MSAKSRVALFLGVPPGEELDDGLYKIAAKAQDEKTDEYWAALAQNGMRAGSAPPWTEIAWIYSYLKEKQS